MTTDSSTWRWCGDCYALDVESFPFGFCRSCWEKYGCPPAMSSKQDAPGDPNP